MIGVALNIYLEVRKAIYPVRKDNSIEVFQAILRLLSSHDKDEGDRLAELQRKEQVTLFITYSDAISARLRLILLSSAGSELCPIIAKILSTGTVLRLNNSDYIVISTEAEKADFSSLYPLNSLLPHGKISKYIRVEYITPVLVKGAEENNNFTKLRLPAPPEIFFDLALRWGKLKGPALPDNFSNFLDNGNCLLNDYVLKTEKFRLPDKTVAGFVGKIDYELRTDDSLLCNTFHAVANLAKYTGVGYFTNYGMGAVNITSRN